jgi:hypothetical protein
MFKSTPVGKICKNRRDYLDGIAFQDYVKKKKKKTGPSPHVPLEEAVPTQPDKSFVVFAHHPVHPCLHFGIPPKNWWLL